jgi:hypothetical protein
MLTLKSEEPLADLGILVVRYVSRGECMKIKNAVMVVLLTSLLSACSMNEVHKVDSIEGTTSNGSNIQQSQETKLPDGFTTDAIKNALSEYVNYRLWYYPQPILDLAVSDKDLHPYIGKSIDVEVRVYNTGSNESVFAKTSVGEWLAIFKSKNGIIYCDGQIGNGEINWPDNTGNYTAIDNYSFVIQPPRQPHYGTSPHKDRMIAAVEANVRWALEDFYQGADQTYEEWKNADVYIADFYEYEEAAIAWICRQDGLIVEYPVAFIESDQEIVVQAMKGFTMENKDQYEFGGLQFDHELQGAAKHFVWNPAR